MQHKKYLIAGILGMLACGCMLAGCTQAAEEGGLPAPSNLTIDEAEYLTWDEVDGAEGYIVELDGEQYETEENRFDLFPLTTQTKVYSVRVMASGERGGAWSQVKEHAVNVITEVRLSFPSVDGERSVKGLEKGADPKGKVVIPAASEDGEPVTEIGVRAFYKYEGVTARPDYTQITGVLLPDTVTVIAEQAFEGCTQLRRIGFSSALERIGSRAFFGCTSLKEVAVPHTVNTVAAGAFSGCTSLTSLTVEEGNKNYYSSGNCVIRNSDLTVMTGCTNSVIPEEVQAIARSAFEGSEFETIALPDGLTSIEADAFRNCAALATAELPASLETLAGNAFSGCALLRSLTVAEENPVFRAEGNCIIRKSDGVLIAGCESSELPASGITAIGDYAFERYAGREIDLPEGLERIEAYAFAESALVRVGLPDSIKSIGEYAFEHCTSLQEIAFPVGLESIGTAAFCNCTSLQNVAFPDTLRSIGQSAFKNTALGVTVVPSTIEEIGSYAFTDGFVYTSGSVLYRLGDKWASKWADCAGISNCSLMEEDGYFYVVSLTVYRWSTGVVEQTVYRMPSDIVPLPVREGYTFAGWATEEGGEVVYAPELYTPEDGSEPYYVTFYSTRIFDVPNGITLYAVWIAEE